jgi:hypothetical protein
MSKKNKAQIFTLEMGGEQTKVFAKEYGVIRKDLLRILVLNLVYLAALLGLFVYNQKTDILQKWIVKWF